MEYDVHFTLVGAAGALGEGVLAFLRGLGARDLAVADIQYAAEAAQPQRISRGCQPWRAVLQTHACAAAKRSS